VKAPNFTVTVTSLGGAVGVDGQAAGELEVAVGAGDRVAAVVVGVGLAGEGEPKRRGDRIGSRRVGVDRGRAAGDVTASCGRS
jgi:hypothetical protein